MALEHKAEEGLALRYGGGDSIPGLPTRCDLVPPELSARVEDSIRAHRAIKFSPLDVLETRDWDTGRYRLVLFGATVDGSKAQVSIDGIDVYFDVAVPSGQDGAEFAADITASLASESKDCAPTEAKVVRARRVRGFSEQPVTWVRLSFDDLWPRKLALRHIRKWGHETASDDSNNYYRAAARRHGITLTDWLDIEGYVYYRGGAHPEGASSREGARSPMCSHLFVVDVSGVSTLIDPIAPHEEQARQAARYADDETLRVPKLLVMTWDIETYSGRKTGEVPKPHNAEDEVFMIGATVHWMGDPRPLHQLCIVSTPTHPDPRWTTVVCGSMADLIRAFALAFRGFAPEIITGFSDGQYDWKFVLEKARMSGQFVDMVGLMSAVPLPRNPSSASRAADRAEYTKRIKVSADDSYTSTALKVPGCVPVDTRAMFMQLFPKADIGRNTSKLSFYLEMCNLGSKEDMPYGTMFEIYEARDARRMRDVAHYCIVDALRCMELLVKRSVIGDKCEVASLSFVSFRDAIFYADSCKVENLLFAVAEKRGFLCATKGAERNDDDEEAAKYPGAWVFRPKTGLGPDPTRPEVVALESARAALVEARESGSLADQKAAEAQVSAALTDYRTERPVTGLDFSSLYPSIIMTYNLSPERFVETREEAERLAAEGRSIHHVSFPYEGDTVEGWFVRHDGDDAEYGIFPSVLLMLFLNRKALKKEAAIYAETAEVLQLVVAEAARQARPFSEIVSEFAASEFDAKVTGKAAKLARGILRDVAALPADQQRETFDLRLADVKFKRDKATAKQKALKVYMNTFYGVTGTRTSPFFLLQIAGGVTTAGQRSIKLVATFVTGRGFLVMYGDTDSVYPTPPHMLFARVDEDYAFARTGKEEYWTQMVLITMDAMMRLRDAVNEMLRADNGTDHLKVAYEEVLYPYAFFGKKKYAGYAHENVPNFRPEKPFIRGLTIVRRGQTNLTITTGERVLSAAFALDNKRDLHTIVRDALQDAAVNWGQWEFEDFVQSAAWRPDRKNMWVHRFMDRMRVCEAEEKRRIRNALGRGETPPQAVYTLPAPGERFKYVLVRSDRAYDHRGRKLNLKKGDIMEFANVAQAKGYRISIADYMSRDVIPLCARFVSYAYITKDTFEDEDEAKAHDLAGQKAAKKELAALVQEAVGGQKTSLKHGAAYRKAWETALRAGNSKLRRSGSAAVADVLCGAAGAWVDSGPGETELAAAMRESAEAGAEALASDGYLTAPLLKAMGISESGRDLDAEGKDAPPSRLYSAAKELRPTRHNRGGLVVSMMRELCRLERETGAKIAANAREFANTADKFRQSVIGIAYAERERAHEARADALGDHETGAFEPPSTECELSDGERDQAKRLRSLWFERVALLASIRRLQKFEAEVESLQARRLRATPGRVKHAARASIAGRASRLRPMDLGDFAGF